MDFTELMKQVVISAAATVGLVEVIKNFIKTDKTWFYTLLMIPMAVGCYMACEYLPKGVIGGILTVGVAQGCYDVILQSVKKLVRNMVDKTTVQTVPTEPPVSESSVEEPKLQ